MQTASSGEMDDLEVVFDLCTPGVAARSSPTPPSLMVASQQICKRLPGDFSSYCSYGESAKLSY